jgi:prepilin-type N-terminal cleavage/methylation domain-containing protein
MKKKLQRGFTLIELMIVVAIIGILAAIAIPAFLEYINKSKTSEADLQLRAIETKVKSFYVVPRRFPAAGTTMPTGATTDCKYTKAAQSAWEAAGTGWKEMGFHVDEDSRYTYTWDGAGVADAVADASCDEKLPSKKLTMTVVEGNLNAAYTTP